MNGFQIRGAFWGTSSITQAKIQEVEKDALHDKSLVQKLWQSLCNCFCTSNKKAAYQALHDLVVAKKELNGLLDCVGYKSGSGKTLNEIMGEFNEVEQSKFYSALSQLKVAVETLHDLAYLDDKDKFEVQGNGSTETSIKVSEHDGSIFLKCQFNKAKQTFSYQDQVVAHKQ